MTKSIVSHLSDAPKTRQVFGVDTETYNNPSFGLKTVQVAGECETHYFKSADYSQTDDAIRVEICAKFFGWIDSLDERTTLAFFNIAYDASQFLFFLSNESGYIWSYETKNKLKSGEFTVLESESSLYSITLRNAKGHIVDMVDIANFLTATSLDRACKEWLGEGKIDIDSKDFIKAQPTLEEYKYAIHDAKLTYRLYNALFKEEVIEGSYITIAGRTMGHFRDYLKSQWGLKFDEFAYGFDGEEADTAKTDIENNMRSSLRGGVCMAVHTGYFADAKHIDARSMYPTQMAKDFVPHGPLLCNPPNAKYTILYYPKCKLLLKDGKLPYLQWKRKSQCLEYKWMNEYAVGEYVHDCVLDGTLMLWADEWGIITECYNVYDLDDSKRLYIEMVPNVVLKPYIEMLYEGKRNNTGTKQYYYKILLNSLYGKFLSRPDGVNIVYEGGERRKVSEDGRNTYYLPLGSWIAMGGRVDLMRAMLSLPIDDVLYCDTDSIIFKGDKWPNVTIGKNLGEWGIENTDFEVNIVGPKTYQELNRDWENKGGILKPKLITKCAGLSKTIAPTIGFRQLKDGMTCEVLKSRRNPETWQIELRRTEFTVNSRVSILRRGML